MRQMPQELISRILSRLPVKELLRCKCVCKSWFDLITDPHFTSNYHVVYNNLTRHGEEHLLVTYECLFSSSKPYISVFSIDLNNEEPKGLVSSKVLNPPDEYHSDHKYWSKIMGPCNGIYFLEGNPNVMMNPSLRQLMALPKSHFTPPRGTYYFTAGFWFGFDPKTNDYKVVVLKDTEETYERHWRVELYSLNSNSWRKLDVDDASLPRPTKMWDGSKVYTYVNNCCHWWGFETHESEHVVLSFDMVNEAFRKIRVPMFGSSRGACSMLAPFDESSTVGLIVYPVRGSAKRFDVWVMMDYWDEGSWVKRYSVELVEEIYIELVGFYGENRFLWKDENGRLVLYEAECGRTRDLLVYEKYDSLTAVRYMESLVSLQRGNESSHQCFLFRV